MKLKKVKMQTHVDKRKKVQNGPFYFLTWIFKTEIVILTIILLFIIINDIISEKTKFIIKYNFQKNMYKEIENKNLNLDYKEIEKAIDKNNFINESEKEFTKKTLKTELEENEKYIDLKKIKERLENFEILYHKKYSFNEKNGKYILNSNNIELMNIAGTYNYFFNRIDLYEKISKVEITDNYINEIFDFKKANKREYFHELNHLLSKNILSFNNKRKNNNILLETINEVFTIEYFNEPGKQIEKNQKVDDNGYNKYMMYAYALVEILPEDIIRKYKFDNNESILVSGLLDIDNNIYKAYELIGSISKLNLYSNKNQKLTLDDYQNIHDGYAYFYKKKYNKKISDNIEILLYLYGSLVQTEEERNKVRNYLGMDSFDEIIKVIPKGYFSSSYKDKNKNIKIEYTKNGNKMSLEINDNMK